MHATTKIAIDSQKMASKKVAHKAAETTWELTLNKITDKFVKPKPMSDVNYWIVILPEQRGEIWNKFRQLLWNGTQKKYLNYYINWLYQLYQIYKLLYQTNI